MARSAVLGFVFTLLSAFCFAVSGPVAKSMYGDGWSPGAVVLLRLAGCAALLLIPTLLGLRGRWAEVRRHWKTVVAYGLFSMVGVQACYFIAVERMTVTVALLLEMTAPVLIVFWLWARTRHRPSAVTFAGLAVSMGGVALMLDFRGARLDLLGVVMAMGAAVCLAFYFLISSRDTLRVPPIALTGLGMVVGALAMSLVCLVGLMPARFAFGPTSLGSARVSWVLPMVIIVAVTAGAYVLGILGLRLVGVTVGSFLNLTEVAFSAAAAWLLLGELPTGIQFVGGALLVLGVVVIKLGERPRAPESLSENLPTPPRPPRRQVRLPAVPARRRRARLITESAPEARFLSRRDPRDRG